MDENFKPVTRILSFKNALLGIVTALKEEPNLKIHLAITLIVVVMGLVLNISRYDWLIIIILIGLVVSLELTNTALEVVVDSFTAKEHPSAKKAKDVAAGAVLAVSIAASLAGLLIFIPYLY